MADQPQNPFLEARPPATDYLTYLTIVEYNLSKENLAILHDVLQSDADLTINIGWDLVHLLSPLLPESEACLQVVARTGNPREVVLKVTEALRLLDFGSAEENDDDELQDEAQVAEPSTGQGAKEKEATELALVQFRYLVDMLAVLHPRIKTKYPSRFLSASLQAILVAFQRAGSKAEHLTDSIAQFVKALCGSGRPQLPPRTSSGNVIKNMLLASAPDPEASDEAVSAEETALQTRLLQSFVSHVLEDYMLSLRSIDDTPGMSWCSRYFEKTHPNRIPDLPGRVPYAERFAKEDILTLRTSTLGQLIAVADDLKLLGSPELLQTCLVEAKEAGGQPDQENEPPSAASDVPLSKTGALFLVAADMARSTLFGVGKTLHPIPVFPDHATITKNYIGLSSPASTGLEPEALIDAIMLLGLVSLDHDLIGEPNDEEFLQYLQLTSLLSANCPSPSLRYYAHYITTTVLRSHPSELVRLGFIRDTLEHRPYENLKASAVGWLKGETVEANLVPGSQSQTSGERSVFATPVALESVAPFLFAPVSTADDSFRASLTFYITVLNFYFLLLKAKPLHAPLEVKKIHETRGKTWVGSLRAAIQALDKEKSDDLAAELSIIAVVGGNIDKEAESAFPSS